MKQVFRNLAGGLGVAALVALLDQLSKIAVLEAFQSLSDGFAVPNRFEVTPFMDIVLTWNRGVSFGLGNHDGDWNVWVFSLIALGLSAALLYLIAKAQSRFLVFVLGLVVGGAIGNVIDRLRLGAVVDFIYIHVGSFDWWPAFNVADAAICIGAGLWILQSLCERPNSTKRTL